MIYGNQGPSVFEFRFEWKRGEATTVRTAITNLKKLLLGFIAFSLINQFPFLFSWSTTLNLIQLDFVLNMSSQSYSHEGDAMNRFRLPEINDSYSLRAVSDSKGYFLRFCSLLSSLAAFTLALVCVVHIICLLVITNFSDALGVYETAYRLYGLSFAIIGVMCEMEWTETIRTTSLLQFWTSRGFFYIFVALFTVREYGEVTLPLGLKNLNRVVLFVGGVLATTGVLYAVMVCRVGYIYLFFFFFWHFL